MADEPDNVTLRLLREIRAGQTEAKTELVQLREKLEDMNARFGDLHETVYVATGFATHAHVRSESTQTQLEEFEARLAKLEEKA